MGPGEAGTALYSLARTSDTPKLNSANPAVSRPVEGRPVTGGWMPPSLGNKRPKGGGLQVGEWPCPFQAGTLGSLLLRQQGNQSPAAARSPRAGTHRAPPAEAKSRGRKPGPGASVRLGLRLGARTRSSPRTRPRALDTEEASPQVELDKGPTSSSSSSSEHARSPLLGPPRRHLLAAPHATPQRSAEDTPWPGPGQRPPRSAVWSPRPGPTPRRLLPFGPHDLRGRRLLSP